MRLSINRFHDQHDVRRMRDNVDAGYGPGYVSDRSYGMEADQRIDDVGLIFYLEDSFDPAMWFIRCASIDEAFEHAEICLCPELEDGDLEGDELTQLHDDGSSMGFRMCADGSIRYVETLQCVAYRPTI